MIRHRRSISRFVRISAVFLGIGTIFLLASFVLGRDYESISRILLSMSVSIFSVTIVEMTWRGLGGGPLDQLLQQLSYAIPLLQTFKETGLDSFYSSRKQVSFDEIIKDLESAKQVDLMAISLRQNWTSSPKFMEILSGQVKDKQCMYRFLTMNPESPIVDQRCLEEDDASGRIKTTIKDSLMKLTHLYNELDRSQKKFLNVRTVSKLNMYCSIVRIDERMLITFYMASNTGGSSPTIAVWGKKSHLFKKFSEEFEKTWKAGIPYPEREGIEEAS